jgi:CcmD family protein
MKILHPIVLLLMNAALYAQPGQSEFQPVTEIPASEQMPSAPLVIAAYAFVWLAFTAYVWMMWRKLGKVEQELHALSTQIVKPRAARGDGIPQASGASGAGGPRG